MGKSHSTTNFRRLWRCLSLNKTKSSLISIINILKIINACQDSVKHGKKLYRWVVLFLMWRHNAVGKIMLKCVERRSSFITVRETVHLVKFIGKGCSIFFSSAYVTLLSTTGYKVLKYSSRIHMVYLAAQQQNKLIQFPVCANVG